MIEGLGVPFRDTSADALSWVLGLAAQPAHAVLRVTVGGLAVELRVLGASHQVLLRRAGAEPGPVELSETVACLTGWPPGLPDVVDTSSPRLDYHLSTEVRRPGSESDVEVEVAELLHRYSPDPAALIGQFPGHPLAVTVLAAAEGPDDESVRWSTWHAYPEQGEIVRTTTTARLRGPSAGESR